MMMKSLLKDIYGFGVKIAKKAINSYGGFEKPSVLVKRKNADLAEDNTFGWPSGHYYSPVHSLEDLVYFDEVVRRSQENFAKSMPGFSDARMLEEFYELKAYFPEFDYPIDDDGKSRFYSNNVSISLMDALMLYSMIRQNKPKRIIEIGSGFTSALMMDVNESYFANKIDITFIDPYPVVLSNRMQEKDKKKYSIIDKGVQFVPMEIFKTLGKGDILFIDSTHVSKFNSDVNYEIFEILPDLKPGVIIHFHDILDGFEYPLYWLEKGWAWNEAYLLRALLMDNKKYEILFLTNYLTNKHPDLLKNSYPNGDILNGGDLWIRKIT